MADWLRSKYPGELAGEKTQVIHTDRSGEVSKKDLDVARKAVREVDAEESPVNAIVSVLMLREGWDVKNVTVVVGLRPYSAKSQILPEQTIGRGLRLMFRDLGVDYRERVDIIGNKAFLDFVDDLEKLEDLKLDTFEVGKDKLRIVTILPLPERKEFDIGLPTLTPTLVRKKSLAEEIAGLEVMAFRTVVLPMSKSDPRTKTFQYDGYDIITLEKMIERQYEITDPQTAQEVIGYYARRIAESVKLPAQFAALAPKVREFFEHKAFGQTVDLEDAVTVRAMSTNTAQYVCLDVFTKALRSLTIEEQEPQLLEPARMLSSCAPFPWSRPVWEGAKTVFNLVPCDNDFEREIAKFLDGAPDVKALAKLPQPFGFSIEYTDAAMNLKSYYPDFVAVDTDGVHWLLEPKGQENVDVARKDAAAMRWCENASKLAGAEWRYVKASAERISDAATHPPHGCDGIPACVAVLLRRTRLAQRGAGCRWDCPVGGLAGREWVEGAAVAEGLAGLKVEAVAGGEEVEVWKGGGLFDGKAGVCAVASGAGRGFRRGAARRVWRPPAMKTPRAVRSGATKSSESATLRSRVCRMRRMRAPAARKARRPTQSESYWSPAPAVGITTIGASGPPASAMKRSRMAGSRMAPPTAIRCPVASGSCGCGCAASGKAAAQASSAMARATGRRNFSLGSASIPAPTVLPPDK